MDELQRLNGMKTRKFRGKRYNIEVVAKDELPSRTYGECDHPDTVGRAIRIRDDLKGRALLATLVDETIHANYFVDERIDTLSNDKVDVLSESISRFLWDLGYRITEKKKPD